MRGEIGAAAVILHGRRSPVRGKRVRRRRATFQSGPRLSSHEAIHVPLGYSNIFVSVTPIIKSEIIFVANFYNFSDAIFVGDHAESEKDGAGGLNIGILIRFLGFSKEYMTVLISNIIKKTNKNISFGAHYREKKRAAFGSKKRIRRAKNLSFQSGSNVMCTVCVYAHSVENSAYILPYFMWMLPTTLSDISIEILAGSMNSALMLQCSMNLIFHPRCWSQGNISTYVDFLKRPAIVVEIIKEVWLNCIQPSVQVEK